MLYSVLKGAVTGEYQLPYPELPESIDCVAAQDFGNRECVVELSPVNIHLGRIARTAARTLDVPIIAQTEIAEAVERRGVYVARRIDKHSQPDRYLDTQNVVEQTVEFMAMRGLGHALVVAHSFHASRVVAQGRMLGLKFTPHSDLPKEFDEMSEQWWTRSRRNWLTRELPTIGKLLVQRKI